MSGRYEGPLEVGMILTCPDNDGKLGFRRVRLIAEDTRPESWIIEDLPSRLRSGGWIGRCPEVNLRIVFVPEDALSEEGGVTT